MSIEIDLEEGMNNDPEILKALRELAEKVCQDAKDLAPVFGETGHDEHRKTPPHDDPGAYRDSIKVVPIKDPHVLRVQTNDFKAIWIEMGSKHMPEYAVFAKAAALNGGTGPDFAAEIQGAQENLRGELEKLSKMHAEGAAAERISEQEQAVERARTARSVAFKQATARTKANRRGRSR